MKKRTIIAIIITIITIIATNKYWFVIRPLPVNFDILGHGTCNIEVQLNKKDNDEFKKVKSESVYINLDEKKHADVLVNRTKYPKRIKLILSNLSTNEPITISNIQFRDGRFTLENIEKFKVDGAKVVNKDNKLILIPNSDVIALIYPDTLHIRARMDFDFLVFGIIFILVYLLAYKLSNYVAEFNTIKGKSRVEIIFLTIFFIFLLIPMIHMNQDFRSDQENRTLATWKPLIAEDNTINFEFGKNFNEWFNDRFNLRQHLIYIHYLIKYSFNQYLYINNLVFIKDNNWVLGATPGTSKRDAFTPYVLSYLDEVSKFCKQNNIKLYIVDIPSREHLYIDKYKYIRKSNLDLIPSNINSRLNIIYPYKEFLEASNTDYVYFKTDHHWTDYGAYIVCNLLLKNIKVDFPQVRLLNKNDYLITKSKNVKSEELREYNEGVEVRYFAPFLRQYADEILDTNYDYYTNKDESNLKTVVFDEPYKHGKEFHYKNGTDLKVVLLGNSMNENLNDFLPYQFKSVIYYRLNRPRDISEQEMWDVLKHYKQEIINNKPDIVILCFHMNYLENNKQGRE